MAAFCQSNSLVGPVLLHPACEFSSDFSLIFAASLFQKEEEVTVPPVPPVEAFLHGPWASRRGVTTCPVPTDVYQVPLINYHNSNSIPLKSYLAPSHVFDLPALNS